MSSWANCSASCTLIVATISRRWSCYVPSSHRVGFLSQTRICSIASRRSLRHAGATNDALYLYREILASGALSEDVTERVGRLERALRPEAAPPHIPVLKSKRSPSDFLKSIIDTSSSSNYGHAEVPLAIPPPEQPRAFPFTPKSLPKAILRDGNAVRETFAPKRGLSLFAPPDQADEHTAVTSVFAAGVSEPLKPSSAVRTRDPICDQARDCSRAAWVLSTRPQTRPSGGMLL
jgi:hypothetical protein